MQKWAVAFKLQQTKRETPKIRALFLFFYEKVE